MNFKTIEEYLPEIECQQSEIKTEAINAFYYSWKIKKKCLQHQFVKFIFFFIFLKYLCAVEIS